MRDGFREFVKVIMFSIASVCDADYTAVNATINLCIKYRNKKKK